MIQGYTPAPRPIHNDSRFEDIGVNKLTVEVNNVDTFVEEYKDKIRLLCEPKEIDIPGWGDYGYLEGCYLCDDIFGLTRYFLEEQVEFVCNPTSLQHVKDDGNIRTDWFMYVRDPDGILVEFVELPDK